MAIKDSLGDRMKENYEIPSTHYLTKKVPMVIRVDGKSFSHFCKRFERPYDETLNSALNGVMQKLCTQIQGVKLAQRHSDEISFVITDYDKITTDSFFEYNISKICSVVASMATAEFCRLLGAKNAPFTSYLYMDEDWPTFDCRCFNIPESDIPNNIWWRNLDSVRNSINMLAQSKFPHKELQGKTNSEMQEMLFSKFGINWNDIPQAQKTGFICIREKVIKPIEKGPNKGVEFERNIWTVTPAPHKKENLDLLVKKSLNNKGL